MNRSFAFYDNTKSCYLYSTSKTTLPSNFVTDSNAVYYHKTCTEEKRETLKYMSYSSDVFCF